MTITIDTKIDARTQEDAIKTCEDTIKKLSNAAFAKKYIPQVGAIASAEIEVDRSNKHKFQLMAFNGGKELMFGAFFVFTRDNGWILDEKLNKKSDVLQMWARFAARYVIRMMKEM